MSRGWNAIDDCTPWNGLPLRGIKIGTAHRNVQTAWRSPLPGLMASGQPRAQGDLPGSLSSILRGAQGVGGLLGGGPSGTARTIHENGQGETAESWIGPGPNKGGSPPQLQAAIGQDVWAALMQQTGLLATIVTRTATAVDKYTPDGRLTASVRLETFGASQMSIIWTIIIGFWPALFCEVPS